MTLAAGVEAADVKFVNAGFETGSLLGWSASQGDVFGEDDAASVLGTATNVASRDGAVAVSPEFGSFQAGLSTSRSVFGSFFSASQIEGFFGTGGIDSIGGSGSLFTDGTAIKQTVDANAGDVLRFSYRFVTEEENAPSYPDDAAFVFVDGGYRKLQSVHEATTGYTTYSYTLTQSGSQTIGFGVLNESDHFGQSHLFIDAQPVPEPATMTTFVLGGLALVRRSGKKKA